MSFAMRLARCSAIKQLGNKAVLPSPSSIAQMPKRRWSWRYTEKQDTIGVLVGGAVGGFTLFVGVLYVYFQVGAINRYLDGDLNPQLVKKYNYEELLAVTKMMNADIEESPFGGEEEEEGE